MCLRSLDLGACDAAARITTCCASARDRVALSPIQFGVSRCRSSTTSAGVRCPASRGHLGRPIYQCDSRARFRDKRQLRSGPHLSQVLRPNRRPHALASPLFGNLHLDLETGSQWGSPNHPVHTSMHDGSRGARQSSHRQPFILRAECERAVAGIGTPFEAIASTLFTPLFFALLAVRLRFVPPHCVPCPTKARRPHLDAVR